MPFSQALQTLRKVYADTPELGCVGAPPSEEEILSVQAAIGCQFSASCLEFVRQFGAGIIGNLPVYGCRPLAMYPAAGSIVDVTQHFLNDGWPLQEAVPVISMDQSGNPIFEDRSGPISTFDHDGDGFRRVSDNFEKFVLELMEDK